MTTLTPTFDSTSGVKILVPVDRAGGIAKALRLGLLTAPNECSKCGSPPLPHRRLNAAHINGYDATHWLDVIWLCNPCKYARRTPEELLDAARRRKLRQRPNPNPRLHPYICEWCGLAFILKRKQPNRKFCSETCSHEGHRFYPKGENARSVNPQWQAERDRLTPTMRAEVVARSEGRCAYCCTDVAPADMHIDHIIPISRGGLTRYDNLIGTCARCNHRKHDRLLEELGWTIGVPYPQLDL